ncbi:hypothetical protein L9F63_026517, partial [Diploptera punctata]
SASPIKHYHISTQLLHLYDMLLNLKHRQFNNKLKYWKYNNNLTNSIADWGY